MKLYYVPGSCARASHIALREAGAPFELAAVDFARAEQRSEAYLAINPKGRVPALLTDQGVLTETPAILAFIAQSFPEADLAPLNDPYEFARVQAFNAYLCSTVHVAHAHMRRGERWADDPSAIAEMKRKAPEVMDACFRLLASGMVAGPWVMGERYSIADPYLFTITQWLPSDGLDSSSYPVIHEHAQRMLERPAVRDALAAEAAG
ncbi:MAG TPA: glutathione S-transferase N-terminal domain-containing protein [Pseudomonadales bacterium]